MDTSDGGDSGSGDVPAGGSYRSFVVCGHIGLKQGYESYITLQDRDQGKQKILADWNADAPYAWRDTSFVYHHHSDECNIAVWRNKTGDTWAPWKAMGERNTTNWSSTQIYVKCGA